MSIGFQCSFTKDGLHLLSTDGNGMLHVNAKPWTEGQVHMRGFEPRALDNRLFISKTEQGVRMHDLLTRTSHIAWPVELNELAAGGGDWAGRDSQRNVLVVVQGDGIIGEIPNAGQPHIGLDGSLTYRTGDDRVEPFITATAVAWGNGRGRIIARNRLTGEERDVTVGPAEYRPFLLDINGVPHTLVMAGTGLRLRELFGTKGWPVPAQFVGDNRNIGAWAVWDGADKVEAAWHSTTGELILYDFSLAMEPVTLIDVAPPPPPIVIPPVTPEPEPQLMVPDRSAEAEAFLLPRLRRIDGDEPATSAITFAAVNDLCREFRKTDTNWYLLDKSPGQNNVRLRGVDVLLYQITLSSAQVVDLVSDAEGHDGVPRATWALKDIRPIEQAHPPFEDVVQSPPTPPPTVPQEPPPASTEWDALMDKVDGILRATTAMAIAMQRLIAKSDDSGVSALSETVAEIGKDAAATRAMLRNGGRTSILGKTVTIGFRENA
jgi:hypothetical protein